MANFLETPEGQAWAARYAAEHNGNMPGQQSGESLDEAIANLMWSQDFAGATGQPPTQQDWEEAWWARQSDDSWFKPYLDLANEALRPDFFQDSPAGQSGGNAPYPGGGAGVSTVPPSGSVTTTNPITGQPQDYFGPERYEQGSMAPPLAPVAGAPAGSGMFSSDYYKQLTGPLPRARIEMLPSAPPPGMSSLVLNSQGQYVSPLNPAGGMVYGGEVSKGPGMTYGNEVPKLPNGRAGGGEAPKSPEFSTNGAFPSANYAAPVSPLAAWAGNARESARYVTNPNNYTLQGALPRTVDYLGRMGARNASALQYMNNATAQGIQGGANNIENFWRYINTRR